MAPVLWQISTPIFGAVVWPFSNPKQNHWKHLNVRHGWRSSRFAGWCSRCSPFPSSFQFFDKFQLTLLRLPSSCNVVVGRRMRTTTIESSKVHAPRSFRAWQLLWQRWQNTVCTTSRETKKRISKRRHACWSPAKLCTWFKALQSSEPSPLPAQ